MHNEGPSPEAPPPPPPPNSPPKAYPHPYTPPPILLPRQLPYTARLKARTPLALARVMKLMETWSFLVRIVPLPAFLQTIAFTNPKHPKPQVQCMLSQEMDHPSQRCSRVRQPVCGAHMPPILLEWLVLTFGGYGTEKVNAFVQLQQSV